MAEQVQAFPRLLVRQKNFIRATYNFIPHSRSRHFKEELMQIERITSLHDYSVFISDVVRRGYDIRFLQITPSYAGHRAIITSKDKTEMLDLLILVNGNGNSGQVEDTFK